jgi:SSS family transporter
MVKYSLRPVDAIIILAYLFITALISYFIARRQKTKKDFILAGKKMHWLPLAIAGVAGSFSAISMMGVPGFVMAYDMRYLPALFTGILSIPVIFYFVLPFLYKLNIVSVYEYLEIRFSPTIRLFASALFILTKLGYLSMVILTPSLALSAITGMNLNLLIAIFGLVTTLYTMAGGMEGVIWTELLQYFIVISGITALILFFVLPIGDGNHSEYWSIAEQAGKTKTLDFSFDLKSLSIWALIFNTTLMCIAGMCNDQAAIQRFFTARSVKDAIKGYLFSIIFGTPIVLALYFIGAWMYGFFNSSHALPPELSTKHDMVFPYFVAKYLPLGVSGIVLAGIFAAGMSTLSNAQHSLTSLFMVDFYERFSKGKEKGKHYVNISRFVSLCWGVLAIFLAFYVMKLGNSIIEVTSILGGFLAAPLGGIYFL